MHRLPQAVLFALLLVLGPPAAALELRRGLNLDIWVEWLPVETMLSQDGFLDVFPDWRRHVPEARLAGLGTDGFDFVRLPIEPGPLLALGPGEPHGAERHLDPAVCTALGLEGCKIK